MPFIHEGSLRYYQSKILTNNSVIHGIFTRNGGVSQVPYASLNLGGTVGDDPSNVIENKRLAFSALGLSVDTIYDVWQVHSANVVYTDKPRPPGVHHLQADAILTDQVNVALFMRFADCVPILLFDPIKHAIGIIHAGWKGTVHKITQSAVESMVTRFGSSPETILAAVGPSIGPDHYEIGPEVIIQIQDAFGIAAAEQLLFSSTADGTSEKNRLKFDLWKANQYLLLQSGVMQIDIARICTACQTQDWYSHRSEKGITGRFGAVIALI